MAHFNTLGGSILCPSSPALNLALTLRNSKLGEIWKFVFANERMHPGQRKHSPKHSGSPGHLKCWLASLTRVLGQVRGRLSPLPTVAYHERNECVYGCAGNTSE